MIKLGFGSHLLFISMPMEMASSIITDLWFFLRRRYLHPGVNGSVGRLQFSSYSFLDLASPDRSWIFSHGRREEYYPRNNFSGCYVLDNGDSYSRLPSDVDQVVWLFCPNVLVLVLLSMLIDCFNGCVHARSLGIVAQIKIIGEPSLVFTGLWFGFIRLPSKKYKIILWKKKEFEDLEDLLVSFRLYFIIAGDSLCISTMYYFLL
jgi:hypothetical protein